MDLFTWITEETRNRDAVVEFGAMHGDKLMHAHVPTRIGIEIFEPYLREMRGNKEIKAVPGDFRHYEGLLTPAERDCAMFIDSLEHVTKDDALNLLARVQKDFRKVIVFAPEGEHVQDAHSGNEWQEHKSFWTAGEFEALGFSVIVDPNFHASMPTKGAIFAVWEAV